MAAVPVHRRESGVELPARSSECITSSLSSRWPFWRSVIHANAAAPSATIVTAMTPVVTFGSLPAPFQPPTSTKPASAARPPLRTKSREVDRAGLQ